MKKRLLSLDAFRGATIAAMILVNTPGSWSYIYPPLAHADWHGCTPTDLVFPFFLFIVGVSMWFSFKKVNYKLNQKTFLKITKRAVLIFLIGLLLNYFPFFNKELENLRILGVLQRIGIAFFLGAIICLSLFEEKKLLVISAIILLAYWGLLLVGGDPPYALETNLVRQIDLLILGENHLWKGKGIPFDPEGLLSTLPAVVTVILGFLTGKILERQHTKKKIISIILWGILLIAAGWLWGLIFPVNKSLWTSSFVLYTAGIAMIVLTAFYWIIDEKGYQKWAQPLVVFGVNSLFGYILSIIWVKVLFLIKINYQGKLVNAYQYIYEAWMVPIAGNLNGSLLFAILHILVFWGILWMLYQKRIFIKV